MKRLNKIQYYLITIVLSLLGGLACMWIIGGVLTWLNYDAISMLLKGYFKVTFEVALVFFVIAITISLIQLVIDLLYNKLPPAGRY